MKYAYFYNTIKKESERELCVYFTTLIMKVIRAKPLLAVRLHPNTLETKRGKYDHSEYKIKTNQTTDITDSAQDSLHAGLLSRLICMLDTRTSESIFQTNTEIEKYIFTNLVKSKMITKYKRVVKVKTFLSWVVLCKYNGKQLS